HLAGAESAAAERRAFRSILRPARKTRLRHDLRQRIAELRFIECSLLVFVRIREELFDASDKLGLGELAVLVGVERFEERLEDEAAGREAAFLAEAAFEPALAATALFLDEFACRRTFLGVEPA